MSSHDKTMPMSKWEFNGEVTAVFDNMLARSVPQYDIMRKAVTDVGLRYTHTGGDIVDLGASRGDALKPFFRAYGASRVRAIEVSVPMLSVLRATFPSECVLEHDLRNGFPADLSPALTLSVLTLQFVPIEYRQKLLRQIYNQTVPGGAFILVEKVLGSSAELNELMVDLYYELKGDNGYSAEQIERKRLSLEGVLVPITGQWNEELLLSSGFEHVDCFWRWMNFGAWLAIKGAKA